MSKQLGISMSRPGQAPNVPANADDFIRAAPPEPKLDPPAPAPVPAPKPPVTVSEVEPPVTPTPRPAKPRSKAARIGPKGGTKTVLANGNQRLTISLDPALYKALRERAYKDHTDLSEILRRAARDYLGLDSE